MPSDSLGCCTRSTSRQPCSPPTEFTGLCALKSLYSLGFTTQDSIAFVCADYGSGPPFEFEGVQAVATAQFGQAIADQVNFGRCRVKPNPSFDASAGADFVEDGQIRRAAQADAENINNLFNLPDFAGLFSGTAIELPRSYALRTNTSRSMTGWVLGTRKESS